MNAQSSNDFTITAHALERFQERFPEEYTDDDAVARLIHAECEDALLNGRYGTHAPLELASRNIIRWANGSGLVVWLPDKRRGYVLEDHITEGMLCVTVLQGVDSVQEARRKLHKGTTR